MENKKKVKKNKKDFSKKRYKMSHMYLQGYSPPVLLDNLCELPPLKKEDEELLKRKRN